MCVTVLFIFLRSLLRVKITDITRIFQDTVQFITKQSILIEDSLSARVKKKVVA